MKKSLFYKSSTWWLIFIHQVVIFLFMIQRHITANVHAALADTPVVFLAGARQTGKSTLAQNLIGKSFNAQYITLDDYSVMSAIRADPAGFIQGLPDNVILDEVQRAPELFLAIKAAVDKKRKTRHFLLTGSANVMLFPKVADSLAGRIDIQTLWPFSQGELLQKRESFIDTLFSNELPQPQSHITEDILWDAILKGGYPEAIERTSSERRDAWFRSYINSIMQRDIRELSHIDGITILPNILHLIAARSANLLNFSDLSRSLQIPQTSLKRYVSLLESTFLVHRLQAWSGNLNSRVIKSPKIYLCDTGLASFLMGIDSARLHEDHTLAGQLLETFVVNELMKQSTWSRVHPKLFHFRTVNDKEIDIVLENTRGQCVGIEVKTSATVTSKATEGLRIFREAINERFLKGIVLYLGNETIPFQKDIYALPISALWS